MRGTLHIVSDVMTHTVTAVGRRATFKEIVRRLVGGDSRGEAGSSPAGSGRLAEGRATRVIFDCARNTTVGC